VFRIILIGSLLLVSFVRAEESNQFDSIQSLIKEAYQNNAELRYYEAELGIAKGQRTQAGYWKNPTVNGSYGKKKVTDGGENLQGEGQTYSFSITQPFEFPGKGSLKKAIANKNVAIAELGLKQFRMALAGQVRIKCFELAAAQRGLEGAKLISNRSQDLIKLLQKNSKSGAKPLLELRLLESNLLEIQEQSRLLEENYYKTRLELTNLLGRPTSYLPQIDVRIPNPEKDFAKNDVVMKVFNENIPLKIKKLEYDRADRELSYEWMSSLPDLEIGPYYSYEKAGDRETTMGLTASLTLPLWDQGRGRIEEAHARRDQVQASMIDNKRKLESQILQLINSYELSKKQIGQISPNFIEGQFDSAELADRQYRLGSIDIRMFLESQRAFLNGQQIYYQTHIDVWRKYLDILLMSGEMVYE
jgi:cobalt-zinc-cadmium efflux system outer membrane protein